jgi:hypothetical protein
MTLLPRLAFLRLARIRHHYVTPGFKAKSNAHSMCAQESSLHTYRIENRYRITNITNIFYLLHE